VIRELRSHDLPNQSCDGELGESQKKSVGLSVDIDCKYSMYGRSINIPAGRVSLILICLGGGGERMCRTRPMARTTGDFIALHRASCMTLVPHCRESRDMRTGEPLDRTAEQEERAAAARGSGCGRKKRNTRQQASMAARGKKQD
jgi:hypothetical protein